MRGKVLRNALAMIGEVARERDVFHLFRVALILFWLTREQTAVPPGQGYPYCISKAQGLSFLFTARRWNQHHMLQSSEHQTVWVAPNKHDSFNAIYACIRQRRPR